MTDTKKKSSKEFVQRWQGKGYEKGESQKFWLDLLQNVGRSERDGVHFFGRTG